MTKDEEYEALKRAARGDIPERYVQILGYRVDGDRATVWMLTNDRAPFEPYAVHCVRTHGRWDSQVGSNSLDDAPADVTEAAARRGWG